MPHELAPLQERLPGCIALIRSDYEPFSEPRLLTLRLRDLAGLGVTAAVTGSSCTGKPATWATSRTELGPSNSHHGGLVKSFERRAA
jgi:hypothetical protein